MEFTVVYTFRKGKVFLLEYLWDHPEALEALGTFNETLEPDT
jgi:hypothetical protein